MSFRGIMRRLWFGLLWPALFVYFRFSRRVRVIIVDGSKVLLVKDNSKIWFDTSRWTVPGGGLRWFEKPARGALREIREELGIELDESDLRLLWQGRIGEYGLRYRGYFMLAHVPQRTVLRLQVSEIATAKWHVASSLQTSSLKIEARQALRLLAGKS